MLSLFIENFENFFSTHQNLLWLLVVVADLSIALILYRLFGKMGLYTVVILNVMLSNLQGPKLTVILGMETSLGVILYSGIYFATDLLSEKYGRREGQRAVLLGFVASVAMILFIYLSLLFLPSQVPNHAEFSNNIHEAMKTLFGFTPLFVFGSLFAYLVSQSFDVWIFHYIKNETGGKHLWLRNNVSTLSSQVLDTVLYAVVVWAPVVGLRDALYLASAKYIFKVIIALIDTIFIYWACTWNLSNTDWQESSDTYKQENQDNDLFMDAWLGKTPLWKVFWIYNIFFGVLLFGALTAIIVLMSSMAGMLILILIILLGGPYVAWVLISLWRCANHSQIVYNILVRLWVIFIILGMAIMAILSIYS